MEKYSQKYKILDEPSLSDTTKNQNLDINDSMNIDNLEEIKIPIYTYNDEKQNKKYNKIYEQDLKSQSSRDFQATDSEEEDVITIRNVHKTYLIGVEGVPALRGVSLKVRKGEFLMILGTSGGGKTTLLNLIGTIDTPSRGDIKIFNNMIRSKTSDEVLSSIRVDQVAFVFQSFNLLPNLNVIENVEIPMKIKGELS